MQAVIDRRMPLLAIGVGMQMLNVVLGGSLYLHLPEEHPKALPHYDPTGSPHRHTVMLEPNTRIEEIYGGGELRVNSTHHQAIKQVSPKLRVGALAPDGVIEAVESADPEWFCLGVQWHPEADTASALDMQLFECFVQACLRASQPLEVAA
jgi:putative glutamine amidotransferase